MRLFLGLSLLLLAGCTITGPDLGAIEVTAPAEQYTLAPETLIEVSVVNETAQSLYYNGCESAVLQRVDGGRVRGEWRQVECDCLCYTALPPGASVDYTYPLSQHFGFEVELLQVGAYRLMLPSLYTATPPAYDVRYEGLVSSQFELEAP